MSVSTKREEGFTLIELSIVIIIIGLLMGSIFSFFTKYIETKREAALAKSLNTVTSALAYYIQDEGPLDPSDPNYQAPGSLGAGIDPSFDPTRFPCPASPTLRPDQSGFGVEQRNMATGKCSATNGVTSVNTPDGRVYFGAVPIVTLSIPSEYMLDDYGRRLTYAVSESVSDSRPEAGRRGGALGGDNKPAGAIRVQILDGTGSVTETRRGVPFVLVGHGKNGIGAYTIDGVRARPCSGTRDAQNCSNTGTFVDASLYRVDAENALQYDDTILFSLRGIADKEDYWGLATDTRNIINLNPGNVGINTMTPRQQLEVGGNIMARSFLHASDVRLKENIADFEEDALKKIMDMRVVSFDMIDNKDGPRKFGLIAQELREIYPELVHTDDDGYLSVDYVGLNAPVIKALQELGEAKDGQVKALTAEIEKLKARLEALEERLEPQE